MIKKITSFLFLYSISLIISAADSSITVNGFTSRQVVAALLESVNTMEKMIERSNASTQKTQEILKGLYECSESIQGCLDASQCSNSGSVQTPNISSIGSNVSPIQLNDSRFNLDSFSESNAPGKGLRYSFGFIPASSIAYGINGNLASEIYKEGKLKKPNAALHSLENKCDNSFENRSAQKNRQLLPENLDDRVACYTQLSNDLKDFTEFLGPKMKSFASMLSDSWKNRINHEKALREKALIDQAIVKHEQPASAQDKANAQNVINNDNEASLSTVAVGATAILILSVGVYAAYRYGLLTRCNRWFNAKKNACKNFFAKNSKKDAEALELKAEALELNSAEQIDNASASA